jgi:hypothetical protein
MGHRSLSVTVKDEDIDEEVIPNFPNAMLEAKNEVGVRIAIS